MGSPGSEAADAVDDGAAEEGPASFGLGGDGGEAALGHAGVVFEGHGADWVTAGGAADDAHEAADAADVGAAGEEGGDFGAGVEGFRAGRGCVGISRR